jgi:hypothetical protein
MEEKKNAYRKLVEEPKGKRPLGRLRCRWEDNSKMDFREIERCGIEWIGLAHDTDRWRALVNMAIILGVP